MAVAGNEVQLVDIAKSASKSVDTRQFVIDQAVVSQGLTALANQLDEVADISIRDVIVRADYRDWAQISTAFQIRHLLELTKCLAVGLFLGKVRKSWKSTSWADLTSEKGVRIEIREVDFEATYDAMVRAAKLVTERQLDNAKFSDPSSASTDRSPNV